MFKTVSKIGTSRVKNKIKMSRISPELKKEVWKRDNGDTITGFCFVCNSSLKFFDAEMGHIVARVNGGIDNLKAICGSCNKLMGTQNLFEYKKKFYSADSPRKLIDKLTEIPAIDIITEQPIPNNNDKKRDLLIKQENERRENKIFLLNMEKEHTEKRIKFNSEDSGRLQKYIKEIKERAQGGNKRVDDIVREMEEIGKKRELEAQRIIFPGEKRLAEIAKEIEQLNLPFCKELVKDNLCLAVDCKKHTIGDLIDFSENKE